MMVWMWMFACSEKLADVPQDQGIPELGPYLVSEDGEEPDVSQVESVLQQAVDRVRLSSSAPFVEMFFALMEDADDHCPQWYVNQGGPYWFDGCTSQRGTRFEGYGSQSFYTGTVDEYGNQWVGRSFYSESLMESQNGDWLISSGAASLLHGINVNNGANIFYSYLDQGFRSINQDSAPQLEMWASHLDGFKSIYFDVVLYNGANRVVFSQNQLTSQSPCPTGSQSIWTEKGWVQVSWNAQECSGCTDVYFEGNNLGSVCIDFSDWVDWDDNPWELALPDSYE